MEAYSYIPKYYQYWFLWGDSLFLFLSTYGLLFHPDFMMDTFIPAGVSTRNPYHDFLLHQLAALYGFLGLMGAAMPRVSSDLKAWKVVIGGTLLVDLSLIASHIYTLDQQGRLAIEAWRPQDWVYLSCTGIVAVLRAAFLAEVGFKKSWEGKKK